MKIMQAVIVVAVAASLVALLSAWAAKSPPDMRGWRHLKPGPLYWTGVVLGSGLTLFMSWIRLFVGSSRPDGETQMAILSGLILVFAAMTVITAIQLVRLKRGAIRWRGSALVYRIGAGERQRDLADISSLRHRPLGHAVLTFADGETLAIDPHATSAGDLLERIAERLSPPSEE